MNGIGDGESRGGASGTGAVDGAAVSIDPSAPSAAAGGAGAGASVALGASPAAGAPSPGASPAPAAPPSDLAGPSESAAGASPSGAESADDGDFAGGDSADDGAASAPAELGFDDDIADEEFVVDDTPPIDPAPRVSAGTLTAGTWDDNLNFGRFLDYREEVSDQGAVGVLPISEQAHVDANESSGAAAKHGTLDVSLVIDTTGSMADELNYLQSEFLAISESIEAQYPNAEQRWSLVVYRDVGDEYEARWFDFREDPAEFRANLAAQSTGGGGDFPEAPESAFEAMNQLAWRTGDDTARLAFWVADAPHHSERAERMASALEATQQLGIHVYPVASSGVDELTELSMRSAAQLTLGRYLFLTNDSGVGGDHKEPSIPCYFVTQLDTAILRMVDIEMSGEYREPSASEVIRTGGDPQDRACTMSSGEALWAF